MADHTDDLRLAHILADNADSLTMSRFGARDLTISTKPDHSEKSKESKCAWVAVWTKFEVPGEQNQNVKI